MIRTFITPTQSNFNVTLEFPEDYLGQELEVIVFKKQEGLLVEKRTAENKLSDKYKNVFTIEDAASFNESTQKMRKEWDDI